ncbi:MAG: hydrolase, partial [Planctomycetota bacterium]|nr:hydrolase [Planctomycetota bacterium]
MSKENTCLLVVDVQEKLVPLMQHHEELIWNISRLLEAASILEVQAWGTEQYPKGLGATLPPIREGLSSLHEKLMFSCRECLSAWRDLQTPPIATKVLLVGIET